MAHLHEDALREYDELELCYLETGSSFVSLFVYGFFLQDTCFGFCIQYRLRLQVPLYPWKYNGYLLHANQTSLFKGFTDACEQPIAPLWNLKVTCHVGLDQVVRTLFFHGEVLGSN